MTFRYVLDLRNMDWLEAQQSVLVSFHVLLMHGYVTAANLLQHMNYLHLLLCVFNL